MTTLNGIDVSAAGQGANFPWGLYTHKISFAFAKISEGTGYADPDAAANIAAARKLGLVVGGYHFLHASADGELQANWFMARCKAAALERGDLLAVDVEQGGIDSTSIAHLWLVAAQFTTVIHDHFGAWPVLYTDISMASSAPGLDVLANCPLWLANPSKTPVTSIGPWKVISFEQTGQSGVDCDVFYGDAAALAKLAIPG